jgi:hypothetical protein
MLSNANESSVVKLDGLMKEQIAHSEFNIRAASAVSLFACTMTVDSKCLRS